MFVIILGVCSWQASPDYSHVVGKASSLPPVLLANIQQGLRALPGTNIVAYYKQITNIKSFITLNHGKLFTAVNYKCSP